MHDICQQTHSVWSEVLTPQHDTSVNNLTILEFEERFSGSLAQYTHFCSILISDKQGHF